MLPQEIHNETDLLLRVSKGDEIAFRQLYDQYRKKIYTLGLYLTKSDSMAQEIVQDVFMKIWEKRIQLKEIDYFNAWLRTIARNTASNYLRDRAIEKLGLARLAAKVTGHDNVTENDVADKEYEQLMEAAIRQLPPQQQKVYILHRQQGLKHEQIAEQLGIGLFMSKKHMKLALRSIRKYLGDHFDTVVLLAIIFCLD